MPGSRNEKRWQDVEELLEAGIDVISTVNIQHLESVNDVVERITGVQQRETLPDEVVRRADQVELVDSTPEALRRRMAHGNIYKPEKVDAALANYFRPGNLAALRELALLWVADKVDESLQQYMEDHGITAAWETRERVVVALTGAPGGEHLVRRARRASRPGPRAICSACTCARARVSPVRRRARSSGTARCSRISAARTTRSSAADPSMALVDFARAERRRSWSWARAGARGGAICCAARSSTASCAASGDIDVHVISTRERGRGRPPGAPRPRGFSLGVSRQRQVAAAVFALVALPLLTLRPDARARPRVARQRPAPLPAARRA